MDSTDCAASVATKRQRVVQPMPGAGGGARTSDELSADDLELSADDLAKLAECDDIGLDLTRKESAQLVAKRRACAALERPHGLRPMQGAWLHAFRLVRRDSLVQAECLRCQTGEAAGSGRHFLKNYFKRHAQGELHESRAEIALGAPRAKNKSNGQRQ